MLLLTFTAQVCQLSAQISIDSPYVITNAAPSSYSISGNNITTSDRNRQTSVVTNGIGGLNLGSLSSGVPALVNTNKSVTTAGSAFSLSESYQAGRFSAISNHSIKRYSNPSSIRWTNNSYLWWYCWKFSSYFFIIWYSYLYCWRFWY